MNKKIKESEFFSGIISLIISQILIKIFGVLYTLYLTNRNNFGDKGNAIYMSGYQIYALLLTVSSIGVPNAISKIIAEKKSIKDYNNANRVLKSSIAIFGSIGIIGSFILFFFSDFIANCILNIKESSLSIKMLSPAIFFVAISSVFRGYSNGEGRIHITAKSQFLEQLLKSVLTIILVEIFSKLSQNNTVIMAATANFATTIATFFSMIYIIASYYKYKKIRDIDYFRGIYFRREGIIKIIRNILKISLPITTGAILSTIGKNIDSITVVRILKKCVGEEIAIRKYGILSSKVDVLISFPLSFNIALSTSLIPDISKRKIRGDLEGIIKKIKFSILLTCFIGFPCCISMAVYSKEIFNLLFPNAQEGYMLLRLASIGIVFSLLTQTINGILQGLGYNMASVYASIVGIILKIVCNIVFIPIKNIYEIGAIIGNVVSSIISFLIVYITLKRNIDFKMNFLKENIIKPFLASVIMIFSSYNIYSYLNKFNLNNRYIFCFIIIISVVLYFIFTYFLKIFENLKEKT